MGIVATMTMNQDQDDNDNHDHDMVMPGFRFHPTEEELIEFYLRRKVEGKRFNVELITFLDLYRYDPWELPALAAIGEKEWYFYVPRDRKYRNGDRPNRVTTSGYWKATGADRMIRTENLCSIGLKKTLVFYSGKAPKGTRTSWIMNEYRLPQHETNRHQKVEISLCRVYKRPGIDDHSSASGSRSSGSSSSRGIIKSNKEQQNMVNLATTSLQPLESHSPSTAEIEKLQEADGSSSTDTGTPLGLTNPRTYLSPINSTFAPVSIEDNGTILYHSKQVVSPLFPSCNTTRFTSSSSMPAATFDELRILVDYQQVLALQQQQQQQNNYQNLTQSLSLPSQSLAINNIPNSLPAFSEKLWEWNPIPEAKRYDTTSPFKWT